VSSLIMSIQNGAVRYSGKPVFEGLSFNIHENTKIALVGRNGAGKTTLMRIIMDAQDLDEGERWQQPGLSVGYLKQDVIPVPGQTVFDYIMEEIDAEFKAAHEYKVDITTKNLQIDPLARMDQLSGGQLRRAALSRALVEETDLLLLDEPTNHLDLEAIQWLEGYLRYYPGTLLCVSHDRTFLANVTDTIFWLDRGQMRVCPKGFRHFEEWSEMLLEQEARELKNRKTLVGQEVEWANRGVKARRKRNVRRVEQMREMRDQLRRDESAYKRAVTQVKIDTPKDVDASSNVVVEFHNVRKHFDVGGQPLTILDNFNLKIKRGSRIGILGKNGSGKTSFLKMLLGEMAPDAGRIKLSKTAEISYFDQKRADLNPNDTIKKTLCPDGGEFVQVNDKERHVCGYVKDFMFDPADIGRTVKGLSGGEKNRLLLAKILANPGNFLILDEPTNDLDMDTLDMLEDSLSKYPGTLFIVSHDRDFLDQTVSQILAFEGDGRVERYIGGYSDYLEASAKVKAKEKNKNKDQNKPSNNSPAAKTTNNANKPAAKSEVKPAGKLSFKLKYELENLPKKIAEQEQIITDLNTVLANPDFYQQDPDAFHKATQDLTAAQARLERYETRWLELEDMRVSVEAD